MNFWIHLFLAAREGATRFPDEPIFDVYKQFIDKIRSLTVIRLHGGDSKEIEEQTGNNWSEIVAPKDGDLKSLTTMLADLRSRNVETFLYVNNHFEESAPRTIARINDLLE